jgi:protein-S-isoprenylcysteine O-methyltransferase Ste14
MASTESGDGAKVRFPPPAVFLLGLLIGFGLNRLIPLPSIPLGSTARIALGLVIVALGIVPIAWARIHFVRTGQNPIPWKPTPELIFQGPYLYTRNPMYVGMTLLQIGLGIAFDVVWSSLLAVLSLAIVHMIAVRPEEAYLSQKFGDPYRQYLARVRRYL